MGVGQLRKDFFVIFTQNRVGGAPFIGKKQLPLFVEKEQMEAFAKAGKAGTGYLFSQTKSWEELLKLLQWAESLESDSVAILGLSKKQIAVSIKELISHVKDIVTGKHDGNPTNPN